MVLLKCVSFLNDFPNPNMISDAGAVEIIVKWFIKCLRNYSLINGGQVNLNLVIFLHCFRYRFSLF